MVCWSVVQCTHADTHTHTHTHTRARTHTHANTHTCMLGPVTLALSSIYLFHYTSLSRTMPLGELWGMCVHMCVCSGMCVSVCVCVCVGERQRDKGAWKSRAPLNEVTNLFSEDGLWGGQKADDSFARSFMWIIAIHLSAALYSGRIACNRGIVLVLQHSLSAHVQEMALCTLRQARMSRNLDQFFSFFLFGTTKGFRTMRNRLFTT